MPRSAPRGGPNGDLQVPAVDLAKSWPSAGPPVLWSRPLGAGYSAIAADRGALFTMYRDGSDDVIIALRADDGATIWEYRHAARTYPTGEWGYQAAEQLSFSLIRFSGTRVHPPRRRVRCVATIESKATYSAT
jgi:hypothetical protein